MKKRFLVLNLPDPPRYVVQRGWAGTFGTATLKEKFHGGRFFPVFMVYVISALMNSGKKFKVIDGQAESFSVDKVVKEKPDVIITMVCLPSFHNDLKILDEIKGRMPNTLIVCLGGVGNVETDKILIESKADVVIRGRYPFYNNIIELIRSSGNYKKAKGAAYLEKGKVVKNKLLEDKNDLDKINLDSYKFVDLHKYKLEEVDTEGKPVKWVPVLTGVGCPYQCAYCAYPLAYGRKIFYKSTNKVVDEIRYIVKNFNIKGFCMRDVVFTLNRKRAIEICDKIIEKGLNIKFHFETRVDLVDKELLVKLKQAGCYKINFGVESGSRKILERVGKPGVKVKDLINSFKLTGEVGIRNMAHVIFGLPGETKETMKETYNLLTKLEIDSVNFNYVTPYPGTMLYEEAKSKKWIVDNDWSHYSSHNIVMRTDSLSVEELRKYGERLRKRFILLKLLKDKQFRKEWITRRYK